MTDSSSDTASGMDTSQTLSVKSQMKGIFTLANILGRGTEVEQPDTPEDPQEDSETVTVAAEGYCIECEGHSDWYAI